MNKYFFPSIRLFSLIIPLFGIKLIENNQLEITPIIIKLIGLGSFIPNLLATDYHRKYFLNIVNNKEKNQRNKSIKENRKLRIFYVLSLKKHLIFTVPIICFLIGVNNIQSFVICVTYLVCEKIFDELQRYLQCCKENIKDYTIFLFVRRLLLISPFLLCFFIDSGNYIYGICLL